MSRCAIIYTLHGLRLRIFNPEGVNGNGLNALLLHRAVAPVGRCLGNCIDNLLTLDNLAEGCVSAVKMRSCCMHDEEL